MSLITPNGSKLCSVVDRVINCLTNDNLINVINPKLDGILPLVPKVESLIKQIENLSSQLTDKFVELPEDFQKSQMTENTQQLKRSAGVLIVTATTIIESQSTIVDGKDVQQPSSSSSGQLSEELRERLVEKWISQLTVNHEEMEPDSDITSELMPDDSVSCVALNRDKQPQQVDEAGTPGPSADTTKNAGGTTNMSTGREKSIKTVLEEGSAHLYPFDETSKSSEDLDSDTVSTESLYREDYVAPTSYNEKSTKELLAVLGAKPEAREWKANETLFDLVKMKPGNGVRSSSNMVETLLYLLEKGGDVNAKDVKSRTPLHHASAVGNIAVVQQLIERDAEPNIPDEHGWTALHVAAGTGHTQVVEVLMSGSADIANETERGQATSLHLAAFFGRASTVEYLLKVGASVNTKDMNGCTPLYLASASGHVEVVETLLKAGSSVDTTIKKGHKSLHFASAQGHFGVVETLLKAGASVDAKDIDGRTALQIASARDRVEVVKFLLKTGASVGSKDQNGYSPLHYAVQSGHETTIELLLAAGADINTRSNLNNTVLHRILYRHKQDCDHKTSCAFCAGSETRENIMRLLCEKGADPSVIDDYGNSPLSLIRSEGIYSRTEQKALARVLKKYGAGSFKS